MVTIDSGLKVYNAVEIINGKPTPVGWKVGNVSILQLSLTILHAQ